MLKVENLRLEQSDFSLDVLAGFVVLGGSCPYPLLFGFYCPICAAYMRITATK